MNVVDWIRETARYMAETRPEVYATHEAAMDELVTEMEYLRNEHGEQNLSAIMSGGFVMVRLVEAPGMEEFQICRFLSSVTLFLPEEECLVIAGIDDIDLPGSESLLDNDEDD